MSNQSSGVPLKKSRVYSCEKTSNYHAGFDADVISILDDDSTVSSSSSLYQDDDDDFEPFKLPVTDHTQDDSRGSASPTWNTQPMSATKKCNKTTPPSNINVGGAKKRKVSMSPLDSLAKVANASPLEVNSNSSESGEEKSSFRLTKVASRKGKSSKTQSAKNGSDQSTAVAVKNTDLKPKEKATKKKTSTGKSSKKKPKTQRSKKGSKASTSGDAKVASMTPKSRSKFFNDLESDSDDDKLLSFPTFRKKNQATAENEVTESKGSGMEIKIPKKRKKSSTETRKAVESEVKTDSNSVSVGIENLKDENCDFQKLDGKGEKVVEAAGSEQKCKHLKKKKNVKKEKSLTGTKSNGCTSPANDTVTEGHPTSEKATKSNVSTDATDVTDTKAMKVCMPTNTTKKASDNTPGMPPDVKEGKETIATDILISTSGPEMELKKKGSEQCRHKGVVLAEAAVAQAAKSIAGTQGSAVLHIEAADEKPGTASGKSKNDDKAVVESTPTTGKAPAKKTKKKKGSTKVTTKRAQGTSQAKKASTAAAPSSKTKPSDVGLGTATTTTAALEANTTTSHSAERPESSAIDSGTTRESAGSKANDSSDAKPNAGISKSMEKPKVVKANAAGAKPRPKKMRYDQQILHHMVMAMKPFSLRTLAQELKTTEQQLNNTLLAMKDKGLVIEKEFTTSKGRTKTLIWANLESKAKDAIPIEYSPEKAAEARQEVLLLNKQLKDLEDELAAATELPCNEELAAKVIAEENQVLQYKERLAETRARIEAAKAAPQITTKPGLRGLLAKPKSAAQLARERCPRRMKMRINAMRQEWKNRKEKTKDFIDTLSDAMEKKPKDIVKILDLETDEMVGATMPPKYQINP